MALAGYEMVKARKKRFYSDHPDGRLIVEMIKGDEVTALFKASVFLTSEDQRNGLPKSTGYAQEFKGTGGANNDAWLENCEESALGRALDNAGYAGNDKCSREEIEGARGRGARAPKANVPEHCGKPMQKSIQKKDGWWCPTCKHTQIGA